MNHRAGRAFWLWGMFLTGLALAGAGLGDPVPCAAGAPTTGPDGLSDQQVAALRAVGRKLDERVWTDPIIETFAKPPADGKGPWVASPRTKLEYDGKRLLFSPAIDGTIRRRLPAALNGSLGFRIDAWVQSAPMQNRLQPNMFSSICLLSRGDNPQEFWTQFAGGMGGAQLTVQIPSANIYVSKQCNAVAGGRVLHLVIEVLAGQLRLARDGDELTIPHESSVLVPANDLSLTFSIANSRFAVVQMAYRGLVPPKAVDVAAEWAAVPGGLNSQDALTRFLVDRTAGPLQSRRFADRQRACDLLTAVGPLGNPALAALAKTVRGEEAQLRIESMRATLPRVWMATSLPDDAIVVPKVDDLPIPPAATQPAGGPIRLGLR